MKKIVGIVGAAAVLASSIFAADVSAATKINGKLFSFNADKQLDLFAQGNDSHDYANPNLTFSISDEKAGATIKLTTDGSTLNVAQTTQTIWFKPIDALKISLGSYDLALNKEQIDWTESITGLGGNGYLVSVNAAGFGLDAFLNEGNNNAFWLSKADGKDPTIAEFGAKAGYSADFGSIGAFVDINRTTNRWTYHDALAQIDQKADSAIKNVMFGAGYRNNFSGVDAFCNVVGYMGDKFDWIRPEVYASGNFDGFYFGLFAAPVIWTNADLNKDFEMEVVAKVSYALDGVTPYVYFKDNNLMAKTFASTIKVGATGNVGLMGWNIWFEVNTGVTNTAKDKADCVTFAVPFELTVSF